MAFATRQHGAEPASRVRPLVTRDLLRPPSRDDLAAAVARFRTEIDHPVGELDDVEVVLDEHERVSGVDETIEDLGELTNVLEMKAGRRLVHDVELLAALLARQRELARDLQSLRLAAGERRRRLAESQIAESDLLQLPERLAELLLARERSESLRRRSARARRRSFGR